jgi:autotransporter-associated beta strand protein
LFDTGTSGEILARNSGTVNLGSLTGNGFLTGSAGANGTTIFSIGGRNEDCIFGGVIRDAAASRYAAITKVGNNKLTLAGANTHTGATNVSSGTLEIGNGGTAGSLGATNVGVANLANLVFNPGSSQAQTVSGIVSGAGNVLKKGSGKTTLNGLNTFTVGPVIESGTLAVNADSGLGNAANAVSFTTGSGTLASDSAGMTTARAFTLATGATGGFAGLDATDSIEVTGVVSGDGALAISGSGVVRLTGANSYLGNTTVTSGVLDVGAVGATSNGLVSVAGGSVAGTGTVSGPVSVSSGAGIKPGATTPTSSAVGTLSTGPLTLAGGSTLYTEFASGSSHDRVVVSGDLLTADASAGTPVLIDLRLENSVAKWTDLGSYNLVQYSGNFSGNANDLFEVSPGSIQPGLSYTFAASGGFITLTISGAAPSEWFADADGNWSDTSNWNISGVPNAIGASAKFATILTSPHTVTVDSGKTVGAIQFNNANQYTIAGTSTLDMNATTGNAGIEILAGTHEISAPLSLVDSLDISLASVANTLTLSGNITGAGGINNATAGAVVLTGTNSFGGNINFTGGSLSFEGGALGSGRLNLADSSLIWAAGNSEDISSRLVTLDGNSVTLDTHGNDVLLANAIGNGGAAGLVKTGDGKLRLAADPTYQGSTTISGGILELGNGGNAGLVQGSIVNNAQLAINLADLSTFDNLVTGTGSLIHSGVHSLTLSAQNTFTGTTSIPSALATLNLTDTLNLQNSTVLYDALGGSLSFGSLNAVTLGGLSGDKSLTLENLDAAAVALTVGKNNGATVYSGVLSGLGSLTKIGTAALVLNGANSYQGTTTVSSGDLELSSGGTILGSSVTVSATTGRLLISGGDLSGTTGTLATGSLGMLVTGGTATFSEALTAAGSTGTTASALIKVTDGVLKADSISLGRTFETFVVGGVATEPAAATADRNLYITGGEVHVAGNLYIGTGSAVPNSSVITRMDEGLLDVGGAISIGLVSPDRWSILDINGGNLVNTDTVGGLILGGTYSTVSFASGNSKFLVRAGTAKVERIQFGQAAIGGKGLVQLSGGELYVGAGGIQLGTTGVYTSEIRLSGGTLGAKANWSTSFPVNVSGTGVSYIKAGDSADAPFDINLSGALTGTGGLTKMGLGKLTLSGGNSYAGGTSVWAGTLAVNTATFDDGGPVVIDEGAVLLLNFAGGDKIGSLTFAGVQAEDGAWGAPGSGAAHTSTALSGTGILYVNVDVPVSSPYLAWSTGAGLTAGTNDGAAQDPDNDGISNLLEFVLGGNPLLSSSNILPAMTVGVESFTFSFSRNDASEAEAALTFQHGTDLATWTDVGIGNETTLSVTIDERGTDPDFITVTIPKASNTRLFGRLKAVK